MVNNLNCYKQWMMIFLNLETKDQIFHSDLDHIMYMKQICRPSNSKLLLLQTSLLQRVLSSTPNLHMKQYLKLQQAIPILNLK